MVHFNGKIILLHKMRKLPFVFTVRSIMRMDYVSVITFSRYSITYFIAYKKTRTCPADTT